MNIFFLDQDAQQAARMHCDKHCVKMILETAQILNTVINLRGTESSIWGYGITHIHHPCTKWAGKTRGNFNWLRNLGIALLEEYTFRYGRRHASTNYILGSGWVSRNNIIDGDLVWLPEESNELTPPAQCMPTYCKNEDPVQAYRNYYITEKYRMLSYTKREVPKWLTDVGLGNFRPGREE